MKVPILANITEFGKDAAVHDAGARERERRDGALSAVGVARGQCRCAQGLPGATQGRPPEERGRPHADARRSLRLPRLSRLRAEARRAVRARQESIVWRRLRPGVPRLAAGTADNAAFGRGVSCGSCSFSLSASTTRPRRCRCASRWFFTPKIWCRRCAIWSTATRSRKRRSSRPATAPKSIATPKSRQAMHWLADYHKVKTQHLEPYLYKLPQERAVKHAFRVASGLDSMVLGEPQILGQFKDAVRTAEAGRHARSAVEQIIPAHVFGRENRALRNRHRREHGVDGLRRGAARRAHLPEHRRAERALHRRGRNDRAHGDALRRAASAPRDVRQPHARSARSTSPSVSAAAPSR